jgi:phage shock protein E
MNNYISIALVVLLAYIFIRKFMNNKAGENAISELIKTRKSITLIDVRQPDEFKGGSVKGAINIPLGEIKNRITELKGKENIVVFCRSGARSAQAASILTSNNIKAINGGSWQNVAEAIK